MALLALTQNNVAFIKRGLQVSYPLIKSAHRAEALAAACGFRTGIALATCLKKASSRRPDLAQVEDRRFLARLRELGHKMVDERMLPDLVRSQSLPEQIWFVRKGNEIPPLDRWFRECQWREIPYVYLTPRRKYATVDWDCIVLDKKHDEVTRREDGKLVYPMFKTFQAIAHGKAKKAMFEGSSFVGQIENVPKDMAPEMADAIFRILYEAICEGEQRSAA